MKVDAPERIWIEQDDCPYFYEESELAEVGSPVTEYVRADKLEELAAENERLRKDAERYRALRDGSLDDLAVVRGLGVIDYGLNVVLYTYLKEIDGDEMDNAIDTVRRALEGGSRDA